MTTFSCTLPARTEVLDLLVDPLGRHGDSGYGGSDAPDTSGPTDARRPGPATSLSLIHI